MGMPANSSNTQNYTRMLNRIIRVVQLCAHGPHILTLRKHQHLLHPVWGDDFRVVVQQKQVVPGAVLCSEVIDGGVVEHTLPLDYFDVIPTFLDFVVILECFCFFAIRGSFVY
jgi:hypothetical protein